MESSVEPEPIEREAYRDLFAAAFAPELRRRLGLSAESCGAAFVLRSAGLDHAVFNRAFGLTRGGTDAEALAESVVARYRAQRIARYAVQVPAGSDACATCDRLHALGLRRERRAWHKLVRGRQPLPEFASALKVERAGEADAARVGALLADGLDLPDGASDLFAGALRGPRWHAYLVRDALGAPYSCLLAYAHEGRSYLALAATDRRHRRRGAERVLIARAVQDALELGCRELTAETAAPIDAQPSSSHHNLTWCGFEVAEARDNWVPPRM
jgi:GNAT superfamily N-acetyltransferase